MGDPIQRQPVRGTSTWLPNLALKFGQSLNPTEAFRAMLPAGRAGSIAGSLNAVPPLPPSPFSDTGLEIPQPPSPEELAAENYDIPQAATPAAPQRPAIYGGGSQLSPGALAGEGRDWQSAIRGLQSASEMPWQQLGDMDYGREQLMDTAFSGLRPDLASQMLGGQRFKSGELSNQLSAQRVQQNEPAFRRAQMTPDMVAKAQAEKTAYGVERNTGWDRFIDQLNQTLNPRFQQAETLAAQRAALGDLFRTLGLGNVGMQELSPLMRMLGMEIPEEAGASRTLSMSEVAQLAQQEGVDPARLRQRLETMGYTVQ